MTSSLTAWSQNELQTFEGFFRGDNLNIQCRTSPTTPWQSCDCIDSVIVNSENYGNILYEGHQVDIANQTAVKLFEPIKIMIYFQENHELRIINPYQFLPKDILAAEKLKLTESGNISWETPQNYPDLKLWCQIEVYKWDDWIKVDRNYNIEQDSIFEANILPFLHRGKNRVRVTIASIDRDRVPSTPVEVNIEKKKLKCKIKPKKRISRFKYATHFKLYNERHQLVEEGVKKEIKLDEYPSGTYFLWFGTQKKEIKLP